MKDSIVQVATDFFSGMGIEVESIDAQVQDEAKNIYFVAVKTPDSKILIGPRGRSLEACRYVLAQMVGGVTKKRVHLHLEVNDYLAQKDMKLFSYLDRKIEYVMESGSKLTFKQFSPYERKKVHGYVSDKWIEGLTTFSTDEDGVRVLHLSYEGDVAPSGTMSKKQAEHVAAMSEELDIDGIDI